MKVHTIKARVPAPTGLLGLLGGLALLGALALPGCIEGVPDNDAPVATFLAPAVGSQHLVNAEIEFRAEVSDSTDNIEDLDISWTSSLDGLLSEETVLETAATAVLRTASLSLGAHLVTVLVTDSGDLTTSDSLIISVVEDSGALQISILFPTKAAAGMADVSYEFVALVGGGEDEVSSLSVSFGTNQPEGVFCVSQPQATGITTCEAGLSAANHGLTFTVEDSSGASAYATTLFVVLGNGDDDDSVADDDDTTADDDDTIPPDDDDDDTIPPDDDDDDTTPPDDDDDVTVPPSDDDDATGVDADGDGYTSNVDCDDSDPTINPGATEGVGDNIDQNCNGSELCYLDADNDGYRPNATAMVTSADADCYDYGEASAGAPTTDCYDNNASANPSSSFWYSNHRGDGSYDYNCDGSESIRYLNSANGVCSSGTVVFFNAGWIGTVPGCGSSEDWAGSCSCVNPFVPDVIFGSVITDTQECR